MLYEGADINKGKHVPMPVNEGSNVELEGQILDMLLVPVPWNGNGNMFQLRK